MSAKPTQWQTVKNRAEEKKKRQEERKKEEVQRDRLGVAIAPSVFASFDAEYANKSQQQPKKHGDYSGAFAGLDQEPTASPDSDTGSEPEELAPAGGPAAAEALRVKKPKVKKPRITVAQAAAGIDADALHSLIDDVGQRYAASEASQVQVVADWLQRALREAQVEFNKGLAERGVERMADVPVGDVPAPLVDALASFARRCSLDALAQVLPDLVALTFEGLPDGLPQPGGRAAPPPPKPKVGVLLLLAVTLRTRPEVLVQCAPELLAAGRLLSAPGRLPQLLWTLAQAAAGNPSAALAAWVRVLLPQLLDVTELPSSKARTGGEAASGAPAGGRPAWGMDAASKLLAMQYGEGLLALAQGDGADLSTAGGLVPVVPGAAVELLSRGLAGVTAEQQQQQGQQQPKPAKKQSAADAAAAEGLRRRLEAMHAPLMVLAGRSLAEAQHAEWLQLALQSAGLAAGSPGRDAASDPLVSRSAASVTSCLLASDACFELWEAKHKGSLRGSCRVLWAMAARPDALRALQRNKLKAAAWRQLLAALPARHRSLLQHGRGWQGACARSAEDAVAALVKGRRIGGSGSGGRGTGHDALVGLLGALLVTAGVLGGAAWHRREVVAIAGHYLGEQPAKQLDAALLQPLNQQLHVLADLAAPHVQVAADAVQPALTRAGEALGPHWLAARAAVAPLLEQAQEAAAPAIAQAGQLVAGLRAQLQDIWEHAKQG